MINLIKQSGKTTLIKSLVKYYTGKNLKTVDGNITIRNAKNQRITFIKCDNELYSLIDLSKIADIAIVMIDASIGFELETFEFISMLKNHGYTNVLGVLSHMDNFPQNKSLSKLKKTIKKRFQREATDKAKLFYLYGIQNDIYPKIQIHNLARYLKVIKPVTLQYRVNNPYVFCDKYIVHLENTNTQKEEDSEITVSFFGYVRGGHLNKNRYVYINGLGDYKLDGIKVINDPCPYEIVEVNGVIKRTLKQKQNTLYAPWCKINNIEFDKKDGFITIPERFVTLTKRAGDEEDIEMLPEGVKKIREMHSEKNMFNTQLDTNIEENNEDNEDNDDNSNYDDNEDEEEDDIELLTGVQVNKNSKNNKINKSNEEYAPHKKFNDILKTFKNINQNNLAFKKSDIELLEEDIYGSESTYYTNESQKGKNNINNMDDDFLIVKNAKNQSKNSIKKYLEIEYDITKDNTISAFPLKFLLKKAKKHFVTSTYEEQIAGETGMEIDDEVINKTIKLKNDKINLKAIEADMSDSDSEDGWNKKKGDKKDDEKEEEQVEVVNKEEDAIEKEKQTKDFYTEDYGYYQLGKYVRIDIKTLKSSLVEKFSSKKPLVLASVDIQEQALSYMKVKLEKHLYYPKILKSNDPIIYSIGWRRFQTTATLCVEDKHQRLRHVKYTPKFTHCLAISYGPIMPVYLRIVAFQNTNPKLPHFRICATGDLLENNQSFQVMKKLKLIGEPYKIEKKTAFIKGMFNSSMEVAKYIGAEVKTVSGIRGQIKKQENAGSHTLSIIKEKNEKNEEEENNEDFPTSVKEGCFRATFEDRILKSDIVYLKTWHSIPIYPFYNPILDYAKIKMLKTTAEIRNDKGINLFLNKDSEYKPLERPDRVFPKLMISKVSVIIFNLY